HDRDQDHRGKAWMPHRNSPSFEQHILARRLSPSYGFGAGQRPDAVKSSRVNRRAIMPGSRNRAAKSGSSRGADGGWNRSSDAKRYNVRLRERYRTILRRRTLSGGP